jgi:hypothetical protein
MLALLKGGIREMPCSNCLICHVLTEGFRTIGSGSTYAVEMDSSGMIYQFLEDRYRYSEVVWERKYTYRHTDSKVIS